VNLDAHPLFLLEPDEPERKDTTVEKIKLGKLISGSIVWARDTWDPEVIQSERDIADLWGGGTYYVRALGHKPKRPNQLIVAVREKLQIDGPPKTPSWAIEDAKPTAPTHAVGSSFETAKNLAVQLGPVILPIVLGWLERQQSRDLAAQERAERREAAEQERQQHMHELQVQQQQTQMAMMMQIVQANQTRGTGADTIDLALKIAGLMKGAAESTVDWSETLKAGLGGLTAITEAVKTIEVAKNEAKVAAISAGIDPRTLNEPPSDDMNGVAESDPDAALAPSLEPEAPAHSN
jgi:hypothetical protein